jgi:hypothetical protein
LVAKHGFRAGLTPSDSPVLPALSSPLFPYVIQTSSGLFATL